MSRFLQEIARPVYMRHPAWRWSLAYQSVIDDDKQQVYASEDKWLIEACHFYNSLTGGMNPVELLYYYPEMCEAWWLNQDVNLYGGLKWQIDAMMMTDAEDAEIAAEFPMLLHGTKTVECFRSVFFDTTPYRNNEYLLLSNVLAISIPTLEWTDCDFLFKIFAKNRGLKLFRELISCLNGGTMPRPIEDWLYNANKVRRGWVQTKFITELSYGIRRDINSTALAMGQKFDLLTARDDNENSEASKASIGALRTLDSMFRGWLEAGEAPVSRLGSEPCTVQGKRSDESFRKQISPKPVES